MPPFRWEDHPDADMLMLLWADSHSHREISHMLRDALGLDTTDRAVRSRLAALGFSRLVKKPRRTDAEDA